MGKEQFIGLWKLVSIESRRPNGEVTYPRGRNPVGIIWYDANGHMAVQIMQPDRPRFASDDRLKGTIAEIIPAFEGYTAYFGTYKVNEKKGFVTHHVEGSLFPNMVGTAQQRFFKFSGNRLILSRPPTSTDEQTAIITWKRAGSSRGR